MEVISFTKVALPYGWLGNMSPYPIEVDGLVWRTSEALFQAGRFASDDPVRETIRASKSPMGAKMAAKGNRERMVIVPQSAEDLAWMAHVLRLKMGAHPKLQDMLVATGNLPIVEDTTSRPNTSGLFWGAALQPDGTWKGLNWLGKLWIELREESR